MKKLQTAFSIYNLCVLLLLIGAGLSQGLSKQLYFVLAFIPVALYFTFTILSRIPILKLKTSKTTHKLFKHLLRIYSFVFVNVLLAYTIINVTSLKELLFVLLFLPFELYFAIAIFKRERLSKESTSVEISIETNTEEKGEVLEKERVGEKDRRDFIKLIAGAGIGFALTSLLNPNRAGAAFFGSVPGPGTIAIKDSDGIKIDPAIKSPTDGYGIANTDTSSTPYYYGFVNKDGAWYIIKEVGDGSFLYTKGASSYNWSNRASETYASYNTTF